MVSYLALIDAGALSTRVLVFQWDGSAGPSTLREVNLGADAAHLVSQPGLHTINNDREKTVFHLAPILTWMKKCLHARNAPSEASPVYIFLLGSALQHITAPALQLAYSVIQSDCTAPGFRTGSQATNALIPTNDIMRAFSWAGLVYSSHTHGARPMSDIPDLPGRHVNAVRRGDRVVLQLEHREWGADFSLLPSSPWATGAAALIIKNGMSLAPATLAAADRLPPFEFTVSGAVHVSSAALAPTPPSSQAPLFHQIMHLRAQEAHAQRNVLPTEELKETAQTVSTKLMVLVFIGGLALALLGSMTLLTMRDVGPRDPRQLEQV
ncbi:hypothetical protein DXG01_012613 [Tephrocybe rancida]|nr:hypothetical protein DXG01_012613 [Tephrocybe rancida]